MDIQFQPVLEEEFNGPTPLTASPTHGKGMYFGIGNTWIWTSPLPFTASVTLGELLSFFEGQVPHL